MSKVKMLGNYPMKSLAKITSRNSGNMVTFYFSITSMLSDKTE